MTFSIIVSVHSADKNLERLINSILEQSYSDFELLLINYGDDAGKETYDRYEQSDFRVKVHNIENGNFYSARNLGLAKARGKWICFAHTNDYVEKEWLADFAKNQDVDITYQNYIEHCRGGRIKESQIFIDNEDAPYPDKIASLYYARIIGSVCYASFRKSIIDDNSIRFSEVSKDHTDTFFALSYLKEVQSIRVLPCRNYHYDSSTLVMVIDNSLSTLREYFEERRLFMLVCRNVEHRLLVDELLLVKLNDFLNNEGVCNEERTEALNLAISNAPYELKCNGYSWLLKNILSCQELACKITLR